VTTSEETTVNKTTNVNERCGNGASQPRLVGDWILMLLLMAAVLAALGNGAAALNGF
jgi:hypothetical protein